MNLSGLSQAKAYQVTAMIPDSVLALAGRQFVTDKHAEQGSNISCHEIQDLNAGMNC